MHEADVDATCSYQSVRGANYKHDPSEGMMNFERCSSTGSVVRESLGRTHYRRSAPLLGIEERLHDGRVFCRVTETAGAMSTETMSVVSLAPSATLDEWHLRSTPSSWQSSFCCGPTASRSIAPQRSHKTRARPLDIRSRTNIGTNAGTTYGCLYKNLYNNCAWQKVVCKCSCTCEDVHHICP